MSLSLFQQIADLPEDPILGLAAIIKNDPRSNKIDLTIGIYRDQHGQSLPMQIVSKVEKILVEEKHTKVYLPIEGDPKYIEKTGELVFGIELYLEHKQTIVGAQAVGGTSALSTLAHFFSQNISRTVWVSDPTWPNHMGIFKKAGFEIKYYPYYDLQTNQMQFKNMIEALKTAQEHDIVLLHGCCHNPSGKDPSIEEWEEILQVIKKRKLFPLFDLAYQGFGESLDKDAEAIRLFCKQNIPFAVAVSHSKNFGLYAERVGALFIKTDSTDVTKKVLGNVKALIRTDYSNPPKHGAMVVSTILCDSVLTGDWKKELATYQQRIHDTRVELFKKLQKKGLGEKFQHIEKSNGMFCFTGLSGEEVKQLQKEYAIFMTGNGRINLTGLNHQNMDLVVEAFSNIKRNYA